MGSSFTTLAHDALELAELQAQLLKMDAKATSKRIQLTAVLVVVGLVVLLSSLPVALIAVAETIAAQSSLGIPAAYAVATVSALLLSAVLIGIGYWRLKSGITTFERSSQEFRKNMEWIKSSLKQSEHPSAPSAEPTATRRT